MIDAANIDRRTFLAGTAAAGLSLGFHIPAGGAARAATRERFSPVSP